MPYVAEKNLKKNKVRGFRLWPEIRAELLEALKGLAGAAPRAKELDAVHAAMLMWSRADRLEQLRWLNAARTPGLKTSKSSTMEGELDLSSAPAMQLDGRATRRKKKGA